MYSVPAVLRSSKAQELHSVVVLILSTSSVSSCVNRFVFTLVYHRVATFFLSECGC